MGDRGGPMERTQMGCWLVERGTTLFVKNRCPYPWHLVSVYEHRVLVALRVCVHCQNVH